MAQRKDPADFKIAVINGLQPEVEHAFESGRAMAPALIDALKG